MPPRRAPSNDSGGGTSRGARASKGEIERAVEAALKRLETQGRVSDGSLDREFPRVAADVRRALALDAALAGALPAGTVLGPFVLVRFLGRGGMGAVYLADVARAHEDLAAGDRVALKILHANLAERPDTAARVAREVEASRRVSHPGVVRVRGAYAIESAGGISHVVAMAPEEGETLLETLADRGALSARECLDVAREALSALAAVHAAGVVHRDVKPANLLRSVDGSLRLLDLGLARMQDERVRVSRTGQLVGSLAYMAPEQHAPDAAMDPRSDLWSLGATLFELAAGALPWDEDDASWVTASEGLGAPSLAVAAPGVDAGLASFVDRLLEVDRERRFASAREALDAVPAASSAVDRPARRSLAATPLPLDLRRLLRAALDRARKGSGSVVVIRDDDDTAARLDLWLSRLERGGVVDVDRDVSWPSEPSRRARAVVVRLAEASAGRPLVVRCDVARGAAESRTTGVRAVGEAASARGALVVGFASAADVAAVVGDPHCVPHVVTWPAEDEKPDTLSPDEMALLYATRRLERVFDPADLAALLGLERRVVVRRLDALLRRTDRLRWNGARCERADDS